MTTPDKPTTTALRADEHLLRVTVTRALEPGPWEHDLFPVANDPPVLRAISICEQMQCSRCKQILQTRDDDIRYKQIDCGSDYQITHKRSKCPVPSPATGELGVLATKLEELILPTDLVPVVVDYKQIGLIDETAKRALAYEFYIIMNSAERIAVCLVCLGLAVIG